VALAGGTRPRAPPSLHAGVAITVPRSGALLTGLATAVASGPAVIACPRCYHCPVGGCSFIWSLPAWFQFLCSAQHSHAWELHDCDHL